MNDDELISRARIGIEAEAFAGSAFGRFLLAKADREEKALIADLVQASPRDVERNEDIRNNLHVINMFRAWLSEAVSSGHLATDELSDHQ